MKFLPFSRSILPLIGSMILLFSACVKDDFDQPPVNIPHYTPAYKVATIAALQSMLGGNPVMEITNDTLYIQGIVTANDESGNIYKSIYIQDNSAGIQLAIDRVDMYNDYKRGQRLYIKCKGLYLGDYNGVTQLGYINGTEIGRIPETMIKDHIFKDSLPGPVPAPKVLDISGTINDKISQLVEIPNVTFPDQGLPLVQTPDDATNRNIADALGTVIQIGGEDFVLRTSKYASFAYDKLPAGKGTVRGILSVYSGQYQMYIRDMNDLVGFDTSGIGPLPVTLINEGFSADPPSWIKYSVASNKNWTWSSTYTAMVINGYGGDVASDDYLITPAINLTGVTGTIFSFRTWTKYTDSGLPNPFEVLISTNYSGSGDPTTATWTPLTCILPAANSASWTDSGNIDLSSYSGTVYIAFHYECSGVTSGTSSSWEVDNVKVTGFQ